MLVLGYFFVPKAQDVISENIYFLKQDGKSYTKYFTTRSKYKSYWVAVNKDINVEEYYQYISPENYVVDSTGGEWFNKLRFNQGSYALMVQDSFKNTIQIDSTNTFTFSNFTEKDAKGRRGIWNAKVPFDQFVYVWVLPDNFEFLDYECEFDKGDQTYTSSNQLPQRPDSCNWVKRGNTLTFYGYGINNIVFKIRYILKTHEKNQLLKLQIDSLNEEGIELAIDSKGTSILLHENFVFHAGNTTMRTYAKNKINRFLRKIRALNPERIIIAGHTDNTPIRKSKFKSNLQLSALRALAVLDLFSDNDFDENTLEIRAFGATRPIASNET